MSFPDEFHAYLKAHFPWSDLRCPYDLPGGAFLRFELGDKLPNGSMERVLQASERALTLLKWVFPTPDSPVWVAVYTYPKEESPEDEKALNACFFPEVLATCSDEMLPDLTGEDPQAPIPPEANMRLRVARTRFGAIYAHRLVRGIANHEMGFSPGVSARIFLYHAETHTAFYMYDDRGCLIWAPEAQALREVYNLYGSWLVPDPYSKARFFSGKSPGDLAEPAPEQA